MAKNAPSAFYSKMNQAVMNQSGTNEFLHQLFPVLRDPQPIVRVCGADALAECLKIIVDPSRKHHSTTAVLCQIYSFMMEGLKINNKTQKGLGNSSAPGSSQIEAAQHCSLLIISDLLESAGTFMLPRFDEVCKAVLSLKNHPKEVMRLEVLRLIVSTFSIFFLEIVVNQVYLLIPPFNCIATIGQDVSGSFHKEVSWN